MSNNIVVPNVGTVKTHEASAGIHAQEVTAEGLPTASVASIAYSATVVDLKVANSNRRSLEVFNNSNRTLFLKYGSGASSTSFTVKIPSQMHWEMPTSSVVFQGVVTGIWESGGSGSALVTEI